MAANPALNQLTLIHGDDRFLDQLFESTQRTEGRAGVDGADSSGMSRAPSLQEIQSFSAAHLSDRDAIGT